MEEGKEEEEKGEKEEMNLNHLLTKQTQEISPM